VWGLEPNDTRDSFGSANCSNTLVMCFWRKIYICYTGNLLYVCYTGLSEDLLLVCYSPHRASNGPLRLLLGFRPGPAIAPNTCHGHFWLLKYGRGWQHTLLWLVAPMMFFKLVDAMFSCASSIFSSSMEPCAMTLRGWAKFVLLGFLMLWPSILSEVRPQNQKRSEHMCK
jgi:hypothetical protein